ncbi:hypothetical protein B0T20DRAFT_479919 [Sordaria brevicollis]|uniref:Uncharacterized protein n=1 Tax=Sordaria brevicollis TaxID=83679 RepID=A0AAE0UB73_SORBR|nr:hypothetical protein B0T20DRAFT_479919 [Sordaria brevicollis]
MSAQQYYQQGPPPQGYGPPPPQEGYPQYPQQVSLKFQLASSSAAQTHCAKPPQANPAVIGCSLMVSLPRKATTPRKVKCNISSNLLLSRVAAVMDASRGA